MNATTDPRLRSFLDIPPESDFPIQNLPYGVFVPAGGTEPRLGVAIGDWILDLAELAARGLFDTPTLRGGRVFREPSLNAFMTCGVPAWRAARQRISQLLRHDVATLRDDVALRASALTPRAAATLCLPAVIGDYTDFYASVHHASNVGKIFRGPDAALPPNYRHLPIGYHGRASSIVPSGTEIRRPRGQYRPAGQEMPVFGPTRELDFELEMGLFVGPGNALGQPIPIESAAEHMFGLVLLNDWSARDIQQWEYQPLGPFLGKNFGTTISPWIVPLEALEPYQCDGPAQEPAPLDYLRASGRLAFDLQLEIHVQSAKASNPQRIARTNFKELYWTLPQLVAHHTVGGCNLRPGDLLATGTISGPTPDSVGSMLELTRRGAQPLALATGGQRTFLEDGDTVIFSAWCDGPGYRIGFGECRGTIRA